MTDVPGPSGDCVIDVSAGPHGMALTEEEFLAGDAAGTFVTEAAEITRLTRDVRGLRLCLLDPGSIRFTAGQVLMHPDDEHLLGSGTG